MNDFSNRFTIICVTKYNVHANDTTYPTIEAARENFAKEYIALQRWNPGELARYYIVQLVEERRLVNPPVFSSEPLQLNPPESPETSDDEIPF